MNVENNFLSGLEFLKGLEELEELKLRSNIEITSELEYLPDSLKTFSYEKTRLTELLVIYQDDWKKCQKDIKEASEIIQQNPYLARKIQDLREKLREHDNSPKLTSLDNPNKIEKRYKELKRNLVSLVQEKEKEIKTQELNQLVTSDLIAQLSNKQKKLKTKLKFFEDVYEITLFRIKKEEQELEELKIAYLAKSGNYDKSKLQSKLTKILSFQRDMTTNGEISSIVLEIKDLKKKVIEKTLITREQLDNLCQLQSEITNSRLKFQKDFNQEEREIQKMININQSIVHFESKFFDSSSAGTINAQIEIYFKYFKLLIYDRK